MATSQTVASTQTTKQPATPRTRAVKAKPVPAQAVSTPAISTPAVVPEPTPVAVELTLDRSRMDSMIQLTIQLQKALELSSMKLSVSESVPLVCEDILID